MPKVIENDQNINLRAPRGVIFQFWGGFGRGPILDGFLNSLVPLLDFLVPLLDSLVTLLDPPVPLLDIAQRIPQKNSKIKRGASMWGVGGR